MSSKLKTLKDIELSDNYNQEQNKNELREEAIKWVKSLSNDERFDWRLTFKHFFNITEEELKDEL